MVFPRRRRPIPRCPGPRRCSHCPICCSQGSSESIWLDCFFFAAGYIASALPASQEPRSRNQLRRSLSQPWFIHAFSSASNIINLRPSLPAANTVGFSSPVHRECLLKRSLVSGIEKTSQRYSGLTVPRSHCPSHPNLFSVVSPHPQPCIASEQPCPRKHSHPFCPLLAPRGEDRASALPSYCNGSSLASLS